MLLFPNSNTAFFLQASWSQPSMNIFCYVSVIASGWFYIPAPCCFNTLSYLGIFMGVGVHLPCGSNIVRKMAKPYHKPIFHGIVIHFAASEKNRVCRVYSIASYNFSKHKNQVYCNLPLHKTSFYNPIKHTNF